MDITKLRKLVGREELDYQQLLSALADYAHPRDKITRWLKSGELIRVKKGLYIFGKDASLTTFSPEILANLIYGPSALSLSYALSFYGLIPERATTFTSITNKRDKTFTTSVGDFTYRYLTPKKYAVGIELFSLNEKSQFLIASPEKALCDQIYLNDKKIKILSIPDMEHYLLNDLRIDENALHQFRENLLSDIVAIYQDNRLIILEKYIKELKK